MSKPLTQWFEDGTKPVHKGVYETMWGCLTRFAYWNGRRWGWNQITPTQAAEYRNTDGANQNKAWRGLAAAAQQDGGQKE